MRNHHSLLLACYAWSLAALPMLPNGALAQEADAQVVVIGSRLSERAFQANGMISVDAEDLASREPKSLEQILAGLPGISVFHPSGVGSASEVFLRGGESNFTAVFVDGVRLNDPANTRGGSFDFSRLASSEIESLTIGTTAMSATYGSDAMAGVMLIATRWPDAGQGLGFLEYGSESDWRLSVSRSVALTEDIELGLRALAVDGGKEFDRITQQQRSLGATLRGGREDGNRWRVNARLGDRDRTSFPEASGGPELAVLRELETSRADEAWISAIVDLQFSDRWGSEISVSSIQLEDDIDTPAIAPGVFDGQPPFLTRSDYKRDQVLIINRYRGASKSEVALGLDLVNERGRDDGAVDLGFAIVPNAYELDRDVRSAFVEFGRNWSSSVHSSIALRFDRFNGATNTSRKVSVSKALTSVAGRVWLSASDGFKLPSFFALGNPLYGNSELVPEKAKSIEIGYDYSFSTSLRLVASVFSNSYEDLIDFDFESFTTVNRSEVEIEGWQTRLDLDLSDSLSVSLDATVLEIDSSGPTGTLPRRPERMAGIRMTRQISPNWRLNASLRYVGKRSIASIPTGEFEDGSYFLGDLTLGRMLPRSKRAWLAIDNLLDADYQDSPGFPASGTRIRVGLEAGF